MNAWGGHSLRLRSGQALSPVFDLSCPVDKFEAAFIGQLQGFQFKIKFRGGGQECPPHTS
jgi:hypothetical protein